MKLGTLVIGLLLAFLLFTPQGQFIGEVAWLKAVTPAPDPAKIAAEGGCETASQKASYEKRQEVAKRSVIPGFDPNTDNHYKRKLPPC